VFIQSLNETCCPEDSNNSWHTLNWTSPSNIGLKVSERFYSDIIPGSSQDTSPINCITLDLHQGKHIEILYAQFSSTWGRLLSLSKSRLTHGHGYPESHSLQQKLRTVGSEPTLHFQIRCSVFASPLFSLERFYFRSILTIHLPPQSVPILNTITINKKSSYTFSTGV